MRRRSHRLTNNQRDRLRREIIQGARYYDHYLKEKYFLIFADNLEIYKITFMYNDFLHMCGVDTDLDEATFYTRAVNGQLSYSNIKELQFYDYRTLTRKTKCLIHLDRFIHSDILNNLVIKEYVTHTYTFPLAIKNNSSQILIGFNMSDICYKGRSVRTDSASHIPEIKILYIFEASNTVTGDKIIYSVNSKWITYFKHCHNLNEFLDQKLIERFNTANHI